MSNFLYLCFVTSPPDCLDQVTSVEPLIGQECSTAGKQTIIADIIIYSLRLILAIPSILQYNAIISLRLTTF